MNLTTEQLLRNINSQTPICESSNENGSKTDFRKWMHPSNKDEKDSSKNKKETPTQSSTGIYTFEPIKQGSEEVTASSVSTVTLSPEIEEIFKKLASQMLVMHSGGVAKTILRLDHAKFASSAFYGAKITISEYSTAPKIFNVEISSNPLAAAMIDASKNDLLSAFQYGKFPFSIHRLDTQLESNEQPLVQAIEEHSAEEEA